MDWGQPYSCESWATSFGSTFPILDDNTGSSIYGLFGVGYVPHNVVIGGDGLVIFSESGFNQNTMIAMIEEGLANLILDVDEDGVLDSEDNCVETANPNQEDIDLDGAGDACDPCDNQNIFTFGNINGTVDQEGLAIVDVFDVMALVDILLADDQASCGSEIADMNVDGNQNVVDIIFLVQMLLGGEFDNTASYDPGLFEVDVSGDSHKVFISSSSKISGLQFQSNLSEISESDINSLVLPEGWIVDYALTDQSLEVIIFDISGENSLDALELNFNSITSSSFQDVVLVNGNAEQIEFNFSEKFQDEIDLSPEKYQLYSLFPNPFNPSLNISFSINSPSNTSILVYNSIGSQIATVMNGQYLQKGSYVMNWDASEHPSGVYFIKVEKNGFSEIKKALLVK